MHAANDNPILLSQADITQLTDELARRVLLVTASLRDTTQKMMFINITCAVEKAERKALSELAADAWEARS